jgi:hypothetical protein
MRLRTLARERSQTPMRLRTLASPTSCVGSLARATRLAPPEGTIADLRSSAWTPAGSAVLRGIRRCLAAVGQDAVAISPARVAGTDRALTSAAARGPVCDRLHLLLDRTAGHVRGPTPAATAPAVERVVLDICLAAVARHSVAIGVAPHAGTHRTRPVLRARGGGVWKIARRAPRHPAANTRLGIRHAPSAAGLHPVRADAVIEAVDVCRHRAGGHHTH